MGSAANFAHQVALIGEQLDVIISLHKEQAPLFFRTRPKAANNGSKPSSAAADIAENDDPDESHQELVARCVQVAAWPPAWMTDKLEQKLEQAVAAAGLGSNSSSSSSADWWLQLPEDVEAFWQQAVPEGQDHDQSGSSPDSQAGLEHSPRQVTQQARSSSLPAAGGQGTTLLQQWHHLVDCDMYNNPDLQGQVGCCRLPAWFVCDQ